MFDQLKAIIETSRKQQILSKAYILAVLAQVGAFLAVFLRWSPSQVGAWADLSHHVEALMNGLTALTALLGSLAAGFIALEDSARKLGLPPTTVVVATPAAPDLPPTSTTSPPPFPKVEVKL